MVFRQNVIPVKWSISNYCFSLLTWFLKYTPKLKTSILCIQYPVSNIQTSIHYSVSYSVLGAIIIQNDFGNCLLFNHSSMIHRIKWWYHNAFYSDFYSHNFFFLFCSNKIWASNFSLAKKNIFISLTKTVFVTHSIHSRGESCSIKLILKS